MQVTGMVDVARPIAWRRCRKIMVLARQRARRSSRLRPHRSKGRAESAQRRAEVLRAVSLRVDGDKNELHGIPCHSLLQCRQIHKL